MTASDVITIAAAADRVGRSSRWLRRHLLAHEKRTGLSLLVRVGAGKKRPTYNVNMGHLRMACPELFDIRDALAIVLRDNFVIGQKHVIEMKNALDDIRCDVDALNAQIRNGSRR